MAVLGDFKATSIDGGEVSLGDYAGDVVLVVNTASKCGYTPQLGGLETLYETYREQGLTVLGFPCNQFGGQEPGTEEEIGEFCQKNYGVTFPMFAKVDVNGSDEHPLFTWLKSRRGACSARRSSGTSRSSSSRATAASSGATRPRPSRPTSSTTSSAPWPADRAGSGTFHPPEAAARPSIHRPRPPTGWHRPGVMTMAQRPPATLVRRREVSRYEVGPRDLTGLPLALRVAAPLLMPATVLTSVLTDHPVLALTYDDGPARGHTAGVLDALGEAGVAGTFFVLSDQVQRSPELVGRMVDEGHEVGLHGKDHKRLSAVALRASVSELRDARALVEDATGRRVGHVPARTAPRPSASCWPRALSAWRSSCGRPGRRTGRTTPSPSSRAGPWRPPTPAPSCSCTTPPTGCAPAPTASPASRASRAVA